MDEELREEILELLRELTGAVKHIAHVLDGQDRSGEVMAAEGLRFPYEFYEPSGGGADGSDSG